MENVSARDVIAGMKDNFDHAKAQGVDAAIVYELSGDGGGVWTLRVVDGALSVDEGTPSSDQAAAATVRMSADDFVKVALGQMNPMQGFMSGKIKIQGDPFLAQKFQGFFKRPS